MKTALAMFTVVDEMQQDLSGTLSKVKAAGYDGIEMYGPAPCPAHELKELLSNCGLDLCGWHTEWVLLQPDKLTQTLEYHRQLGNRTLVIPCLGGPWNVAHTAAENTSSTWMRHIEYINTLCTEVGREGFRLGYHTHAHEFEPTIDGVLPWDLLLQNTSPELFLELDTGNCLEAGADVCAALRQAKGRLHTLHCKPYGFRGAFDCALGSEDDRNPWRKILNEAAAGGCQWLAVENESQSKLPKTGLAADDLAALHALLAN